MKSELDRDFIDRLKELAEMEAADEIREMLEDLHPADIAEIMEELTPEEAKYLYLQLDGELASDVLIEIPENYRRRFLKMLPPELIASRFIEHMDSDDAADILGDLDESTKEAVLQQIEDKEQAGDIADLLGYDEESAGGLMAKELVKVNENWTVQTCLKEISRQAEEIDEIYYVYIVNDDNILKSVLSLSRLIQKPTHTKVKELIHEDIQSVRTDTTQEEVAQIMEKYDLVALPVVDHMGRLKGRITIDDVVDVIREEAEKDYNLVSGITGDVDASDKVLQQTRARIPWLLIGIVGGVLGSRVLGSNESTIGQLPAMAFFIPMIAATAGNVGVQSSSIVVQSLASGTRSFDSIWKNLFKELMVGFITALVISVIIFIYNYFFSSNHLLTMAVSCTLFIVIIFASTFGTLIPLILNKFKIDPALATGPFITTLNDIFGMIIYMSVVRSFLTIM